MTQSALPTADPLPCAAVANVLTIAGVDPSGGAGLVADIKTFAALGVYGCGVVTALTAQNTLGVSAIELPSAAFVRAQITTLFADMPIAAAKTGMLGDATRVETVAESLAEAMAKRPLPLVVDPVMVATSGDPLLSSAAITVLRERLLPLATVLTPNLPEAAVLTGRAQPQTVAEMRTMARALRDLLPAQGGRWVLLKGGHLPEREPLIDVAFDGQTFLYFPAARQPLGPLHGTGCTLAAAITALLGRWAIAASPNAHLSVPAAESIFSAAHRYVQGAVAAASYLAAGNGAKPLFHAFNAKTPPEPSLSVSYT